MSIAPNVVALSNTTVPGRACLLIEAPERTPHLYLKPNETNLQLDIDARERDTPFTITIHTKNGPIEMIVPVVPVIEPVAMMKQVN